MNIYFVFFAVIMQGIITLAHFVVYKAFAMFTTQSIRIQHGYLYFFIGVSFLFTLGTLLIQLAPSRFSNGIYYLGSIWMGTFFWLFVASIVLFIVNIFFYTTSGVRFFSILVFLFATCVSAYGLYNAREIKIVEYSAALENLPKEWEGRKAVFFADSHFGTIQQANYAKRLVSLINSQNPDIVFMAGDFYDGPKTDFKAVGGIFNDMNPPHGKFFVTGNHEEYAGIPEALDGIKAGGFVVLDEETKTVEGVQIIGIPYHQQILRSDISTALANAKFDETIPSIVLKHVPKELNFLEEKKVSLVLSGHTHRGQAWPFSLLTNKVYNGYDYGLKPLGNMQVLTTSGAGTWGPPQRIGTNNEIVIITFQKK